MQTSSVVETLKMSEHRRPANIMIVDDTPQNLKLLEGMLREQGHRVFSFPRGDLALKAAAKNTPDLILLDVNMPGMNGYQVCERLRGNETLREVPVIFISALNELIDKVRAFEVGGVDYVAKPFQLAEVHARVETQLELRSAREALRRQNEILEEKVRERTKELADTQDVMIYSLAALAEYRDNETGGHIMRTQRYVRTLATRLASHPRFHQHLDGAMIDLLFKSTPLHDIGKVAIPDHILLKPGRLTVDEFEKMKKHAIYGRDAITKAEERLGRKEGSPFFRIAREITVSHHEKWNGSGYPYGLEGEEIPLSGRLMAIFDVYDALVAKRVYKPPFPHEEAVEIITQGDGRVQPEHFDPDIVKAFAETHETFRQIALAHADHAEECEVLSRPAASGPRRRCPENPRTLPRGATRPMMTHQEAC